ncbi:enkurin isoform X3 [Panthera onca]|uniref:enkurin isoform X3 n=1 Tax=Panthera leo TaxID=9689 RepID=UPI001C69BB0A|nr:enkurin isoform X3 [Panthera leo]XP_060515127.1 enkurin isoform X3 [Panthera onca]
MDTTCFSESIYNLIPSDRKEPPQPPRYVSIFKASIKDNTQKCKAAMKTMGPPKVELPSPKNFLKKHSMEKTLPPKKKFDWNEPRKPPVPLRTDHPVMGIRSEKNFINTNAADVILGVTKKPKPIYVDKRTGDKHDLETSGLFPKYINKKGLKKNWEEVHKEFQSLSVFIDSIPKKIRKQKLEEKMKQLEHDIGVIEKHRIIYIANK